MVRAHWKTALWLATAMLVWAVAVIAMPLFGIGGLLVSGTGSEAFVAAVRDAARDHPGNLALVLVEDGAVAETHAMSIGRPVSGETMFQMASISKWVTTWGVLALVDAGKVDLDAPVSRYVRRWQLPPGDYPMDQVTVRRLLTHTAGLTDGLGYCGFAPGTPIQTLEASLTKAADACPLRTGVVETGAPAGSLAYSGGGFTLLQLLIEEVSGEPFADYMQRAVLLPLGMKRSTFRTGAQGFGDLAEFYDGAGEPAPHYRYTAAAAASLYSSANDMARFAQAHLPGTRGEPIGRGVVSPESLAALRSNQASILNTPHWGLGVQIYAASKRGGAIYGHDGGNMPAVSNTVRIEQASGDAIVALSTGGSVFGGQLGSQWTRLRRAAITPAMVHGAVMRFVFPATAWRAWGALLSGWVVIAGVFVMAGRRRRRQRANAVSQTG